MKGILRVSSARIAIVAVLLFSWLLITNHCALGLMSFVPAAKKAHACCEHGDDAPRKAPERAPLACCKTIKAQSAEPGAAILPSAREVGEIDYADLFKVLSELCLTEEAMIEHGPPRAWSFAEIVLQRCVLGHAPPVAG